MKNSLLKLIFAMTILMIGMPMNAQSSREYIRNAIKKWGECRNVAITRTNGDIALYGQNGCAEANTPSGIFEQAITNDQIDMMIHMRETYLDTAIWIHNLF